MNMNPQQMMMQMMPMMLMQIMQQTAPTPTAPAEQPAVEQTLRLCRTVSVYKSERDGKRRMSIGNITVPYSGEAKRVSTEDLVQSTKNPKVYRSRNEWEVVVAVSSLGYGRVISARDTGRKYVADLWADDEDEAPAEDSTRAEEKETL